MDESIKKSKPFNWCKCGLITSGLVTLSFGLLFLRFPQVLNVAIRSQLNLDESGPIYPQWTKVPIAIHYRYYFFEVLNPVEATNGQKVNLREHGPYCFNQYRTKRILKWGPNNETVKYLEYKSYVFDPVCSGSNSLDDTYYTINPLFVALGEALSDMINEQLPMAPITAPAVFTLVNGFLDMHGQSLFMKRSIREIMFGFKVNILDTIDTLVGPLKNMGIKLDALPPSPPDNMFGLLYGRNNTPEGPYELFTGLGNTWNQFGYFVAYKDKTKLDWWPGEYCNQLKGSDGSLFPAGVTKSTVLSAFGADICRSLDFGFQQDSEYMEIPALRFGIDFANEAFASPEKNPDNECFCIWKKANKRHRCKINGIMDAGGCQNKAPLIFSCPHFLDTNPDLSQLVDGLKPDPRFHSTYVDIEPTTGAPIYGTKKLQISLRVERVAYLRNLQGVQNAYIPFLWAEEEGGLDDKLAGDMKAQLIVPVKYARSVVFVISIISFLVLVTLIAVNFFYKLVSGIFNCLCCCFKSNKNKTYPGNYGSNIMITPRIDIPKDEVNNNKKNFSNSGLDNFSSSNLDNSKSIQVKMLYPQPDQRDGSNSFLPEPPIMDRLIANEIHLRSMNQTNAMKNHVIETERQISELRNKTEELRIQNQHLTTMNMITQSMASNNHNSRSSQAPVVIVNVPSAAPSRQNSRLGTMASLMVRDGISFINNGRQIRTSDSWKSSRTQTRTPMAIENSKPVIRPERVLELEEDPRIGSVSKSVAEDIDGHSVHHRWSPPVVRDDDGHKGDDFMIGDLFDGQIMDDIYDEDDNDRYLDGDQGQDLLYQGHDQDDDDDLLDVNESTLTRFERYKRQHERNQRLRHSIEQV